MNRNAKLRTLIGRLRFSISKSDGVVLEVEGLTVLVAVSVLHAAAPFASLGASIL